MAYNPILKDTEGNGVPQFYNELGVPQVMKGEQAPYQHIVDSAGVMVFTSANPGRVSVTTLPAIPAGSNLIGQVHVPNVVSMTGTVDLTGSNQLKGDVIKATTAGAPVRLPTYPCREVTIIALKGNTGSIFVGGSDVSLTRYGVDLGAKESFTFTVSNTNMIYIAASNNGEGISYVAI